MLRGACSACCFGCPMSAVPAIGVSKPCHFVSAILCLHLEVLRELHWFCDPPCINCVVLRALQLHVYRVRPCLLQGAALAPGCCFLPSSLCKPVVPLRSPGRTYIFMLHGASYTCLCAHQLLWGLHTLKRSCCVALVTLVNAHTTQ
eukprot:1160478-Pelagomonas_calceolata.AAC.10